MTLENGFERGSKNAGGAWDSVTCWPGKPQMVGLEPLVDPISDLASALGGFVALVLFVIPGLASPDGQPVMEMEPLMGALQGFFGVGAVALALGITVLMQDELITEKQLGTAEWVLSKPVSRSAFLLAKLVAHTLGMLVVMVALPSAGVYALLAIYSGALTPWRPSWPGSACWPCTPSFYLCLDAHAGGAGRAARAHPGGIMASFLGGSFIRILCRPDRLCSPPGSCPTWAAWRHGSRDPGRIGHPGPGYLRMGCRLHRGCPDEVPAA
jgi:hypothetical protein